jgi:hypothetical protein
MNTNDNYEVIRNQQFELISWKDDIDLKSYPIDGFDAIKVNWISYTTETTGLKQISIRINNIAECNKSSFQSLDGTISRDFLYGTYLDTRSSVLVFQENPLPPIDLARVINRYTTFSYEIYVNNNTSHAGIDVSNPVFCEIAFLKKN